MFGGRVCGNCTVDHCFQVLTRFAIFSKMEDFSEGEEVDIVCTVDRLRDTIYFMCHCEPPSPVSERAMNVWNRHVPGMPRRSRESSSTSSILRIIRVQHRHTPASDPYLQQTSAM